MPELARMQVGWGELAISTALLGVAFVAARAAQRVLATPTRGAICAPYRFDAMQVREIIGEQIDKGQRDPYLAASNTAVAMFGAHPDGGWVSFPPTAESRPEVKCVWERINELVDEVFTARGVEPALPADEAWSLVDVTGSDLGEYPWNRAVFDVRRRPAPGTFFLTKFGDTDPTVFRDALKAALEMAGVPSAVASDPSSRVARRLRKEFRDIVLCSPFNDGRVTSESVYLAGGRAPGTKGPNDAGVTHMMGPNGRGLVWSARHHDDVARISLALQPERGIDLQGEPLGTAKSWMLLYIPAVNLAALRGETPVVTVDGMEWPDGRSTLDAPTPVSALGLDLAGVELPGGVGCSPSSTLVG